MSDEIKHHWCTGDSHEIRLRFHLSRGKDFEKWQVSHYVDGERDSVHYYDPEEVTLFGRLARLHNRPRAAEKIHGGKSKFPCAWMVVDEVLAFPNEDMSRFDPPVEGVTSLCYNPKDVPHWTTSNINVNMDDATFDNFMTDGRRIYGWNNYKGTT